MQAKIAEGLTALAVPVSNLVPDPNNARRGDVTAIRRSLSVFGQRKPVVVRHTGEDAEGKPTGVVMAGNHTYSAAVDLGWSHVAAVFVNDDETTAKAYALADNRTGELASWDADQLAATLRELSKTDEIELTDLGWSTEDLSKLIDGATASTNATAPDEFPEYDDTIATDHTCPACGYQWSGGK